MSDCNCNHNRDQADIPPLEWADAQQEIRELIRLVDDLKERVESLERADRLRDENERFSH